MVSCLFAGILCIALSFQFSPTAVIAGEGSVGSWISGALLIVASTAAGVLALHRGWYPWLLFTFFFFLLAVDEYFMIHEALKRSIIFVTYEKTDQAIYWLGEVPVVLAACMGAVVAWILSRNVLRQLRWMIVIAVIFGTASVVFDVLGAGVLWEDSFKLIGEWALACLIVTELESQVGSRTRGGGGEQ